MKSNKKRKNLKPPKPKFPPLIPHIESNSYSEKVAIVRIPEHTPREEATKAIKAMWQLAAKYCYTENYW